MELVSMLTYTVLSLFLLVILNRKNTFYFWRAILRILPKLSKILAGNLKRVTFDNLNVHMLKKYVAE